MTFFALYSDLILSASLVFISFVAFIKANQLSSAIARLSLCMVGGLLGFSLYGVLMNFRLLEFDGVLNFGDVIQSLSTLIVAILVTYYFQRNTESERRDKDIILKHLDLVLDALKEVEQFKDGGVLTKVTASLKKLSVQCRAVRELIIHLQYGDGIIDQTNFDENIKEIRKLATETPIKKIKDHANSNKCTSTVRDGIIKLAQEKTALLDSEIQKMKLAIMKSQIQINRA